MSPVTAIAALLLLASAAALADNSTVPDTCSPEVGPWSAALEDWVTADHGNSRHGRIMALPPSQGYYVSDRIDLVPPPPPHHHGQAHGSYMLHRGPYPAHPGSQQGSHPGSHSGSHGGPNHGPQESQSSRLQQQAGPPKGSLGPVPSNSPSSGSMPYDEWQATPPPPPGAGKIVNRPPNPYKDQFKPSYPPPSPPQQIPVHSLADRVDESRPPPHKQVSETDLYLLGAIEKLVYRVDLMEKRLRKMEENMHYLVVGSEAKPEPCQANFTRVGAACYHVSSEALNWKSANYACRKLKAHLLELDDEEMKAFTAGLVGDKNLKGADYWTGGLNPGLLWIWSHSAAAVANTTADAKDSTTVVGEGRCLALVHDPAVNTYVYRGQDCGLRHRYVCEKNEDKTKLSNEIERVAKMLRGSGGGAGGGTRRAAKMKWLDGDDARFILD